jgi:radical SAM superfamily enzyme YgiQ (UPF0313 family)
MMRSDGLTTTLLISCYELGHQPAGIAMPLGMLQRASIDTETMDISVEGFDEEKVRRARFVGISVPMHTALRLGLRIAETVRKLNPEAHICFYGLYATLNQRYLLDTVADSVIGGEFEQGLVDLISAVRSKKTIDIEGVSTRAKLASPMLARLTFSVPDRSSMAPLEHYAKLDRDGEQHLTGYVEASRGCLHFCTHCPIPPVYGGRFFIVPEDVVLNDVRRLVTTGAKHITFGDPDFLNGPGHALKIARAIHTEFPSLTFDFTAKVEHLLKHRKLMPEFAGLGCVFVVSAVESLSNVVLSKLKKGHVRDDVFEGLSVLRDAGIAMRPTFVSFTPWGTIDDYIDVLEFVESEDLIDHVDPVQFSIRLLIPPGSLLLEDPDRERWLGPLIQESFSYEWSHPDPQLDDLHRNVTEIVEQAVQRNEDAAATFLRIREVAYAVRGGSPMRQLLPMNPLRRRPPRLTEAWFC